MSNGSSTTPSSRWSFVFLAAVAYFLAAFGAGFVLGALRTGVLTLWPALGRLGAVAIEVPFMLAFCWLACGWIIARFGLSARWPARAIMGGIAFLLLQLAEIALGMLLMGINVATQIAALATPAGALGLVAQAAFGLFPLFAGVRTFRDRR